jgi:hypothetical protein
VRITIWNPAGRRCDVEHFQRAVDFVRILTKYDQVIIRDELLVARRAVGDARSLAEDARAPPASRHHAGTDVFFLGVYGFAIG